MVDVKAYRLALRSKLLDEPTLATWTAATQFAWTNKKFTPTTSLEYLEESFVLGTPTRITQGASAWLEYTPMYFVNLRYPINDGIGDIDDMTTDLLTHFAPGTDITASNGDVLRVRGDVAPYASEVLQVEPGWAGATVAIPLRVRTVNSV